MPRRRQQGVIAPLAGIPWWRRSLLGQSIGLAGRVQVHGQGQLRVGARSANWTGEPRVDWPGLRRKAPGCRTRRRSLEHRSTWSASASTICETYGLAKEGARHHGYDRCAGAITRCWPARAPAPATCCWPACRAGRANTARGSCPSFHGLKRSFGGGCATAGARGQLRVTVRATVQRLLIPNAVVAVCRRMACPLLHRHPPRGPPAQSRIVEAIPEDAWTANSQSTRSPWTAPPMWP